MAPVLRGYFSGPRRQPYVVTQVVLPRLGAGAEIHFLADTGADRTVVHWSDRALFRTAAGSPLPRGETFSGRADMSGISGAAVQYGEEGSSPVLRGGSAGAGGGGDHGLRRADAGQRGRPLAARARLPAAGALDFYMPGDELTIRWET